MIGSSPHLFLQTFKLQRIKRAPSSLLKQVQSNYISRSVYLCPKSHRPYVFPEGQRLNQMYCT